MARPYFNYNQGIRLSIKAFDIGNFILDQSSEKILSRYLDSSWLFYLIQIFYRNEMISDNELRCPSRLNRCTPANLELMYDVLGERYTQTCLTNLSDIEIFRERVQHQSSLKTKVLNLVNTILNKAIKYLRNNRILAIELYHLRHFERDLLKRFYRSIVLLKSPKNMPTVESADSRLRQNLENELLEILTNYKKSTNIDEIKRLVRFCSKYAPISHMEEKNLWKSWATKSLDGYRFKNVVTAIGLYFSTYASYLIYTAKCSGAKLIGIQHGGYFGYTYAHTFPVCVEAQACDYFFSWGWKQWPSVVGEAKSQVLPVGSFYLPKLKICHQLVEQKSALFCPTVFHNLPPYLDENFDIDSIRIAWEINIRVLLGFIKENGYCLSVKAYWGDKGKVFLDLLKKRAACKGVDLKLVQGGTAQEHFTTFKVIIWDSLGTGFFESLYKKKATYLLPSARLAPRLSQDISISSKFFLPVNLRGIGLLRWFAEALAESKTFVETYGKSSTKDLYSVLAGITSNDKLSYDMQYAMVSEKDC